MNRSCLDSLAEHPGAGFRMLETDCTRVVVA